MSTTQAHRSIYSIAAVTGAPLKDVWENFVYPVASTQGSGFT